MKAIEIHDDIWTETNWTYSDSNCQNVVLEHQQMYQFQIDSNNFWNGKSLMSYLRPYTNDLATFYNNKKYCGVSNWLRGRIIEITGLICDDAAIPKENQMLYSIIKTEGPENNELWTGVSSQGLNGINPSSRYQVLSNEILIRDPQM